MSLEELIPALHTLSRADKLRAIQVLVDDLAVEEEALLVAGVEMEIFTPYGNETTAEVLYCAQEFSDQPHATSTTDVAFGASFGRSFWFA
jgi:hypothetical protein